MAEGQLQNLIYLTILLAFIGYFTFGGYRESWPRMGKYALIWIGIFGALFLAVRLTGN